MYDPLEINIRLILYDMNINLDNSNSVPFQTPPDHSPGGSDDLVFSGAGSGCPNDDEDSCTPSFDTSPGDDLITPVYVPPTPRSKKPLEPQCRDDDEDCVTDGSGKNCLFGGRILSPKKKLNFGAERY